MNRPLTPRAPLPNMSKAGTNPAELIEQKNSARHVLEIAIAALKGAAPHPRDYIVSPDSFVEASKIHDERIETLAGIASELYGEAIAISDTLD